MPRTIFRVFFSSTFGDFQAEREKLRAEVWPRLEALCASYGASFHVVDLRWGISPSVATTHDTIQICLDEVKRCQELSPFPKPNFLMLIGDRYGWRPPAVEIPDADFQLIRKAASKDDAAFLASWYRKDENAVPPVWLLKPREGEYASYDAWGPVESRLVAIQHTVAEKINLAPEKYLYSATHMEIVDGLLKLEGVQDHIFTCNRTLEGLPDPAPKGIARRFADYLPDGSRDSEAVSLLSVLKEQIAAVLPDSQVHLFNADWLGDEKQPISTHHLEQLCADVEASLLNVIKPELEQMAATTPLQEELEGQRQFLAETGALLIGRDKELKRIQAYLNRRPFDAAQGKRIHLSSRPLAAAANQRLWHGRYFKSPPTPSFEKGGDLESPFAKGETGGFLIYRFIGAAPRSWQPQSFLEDLIAQIAQTYGQETPSLPEEGGIKALGELLNEQLQLATEEQPLTIFIDAIDQFSSTSPVQYRDIFPEELPDNVRMVISVLNGKDAEQLGSLYPKSPRINLEPLSPTACGRILDALLGNRKLSKEQRTTILDKAKESGLPLWLTLSAPIARKLKSWDTAPDLPADIKELARYVVKRIADKHGPAITIASIRYIKLARYGLSETELQEILWADPDVRAEFNATKNPDQPEVTELPPIFWSRLYAELDPYINEYWMDGQLLHRYFHRVFGEVADEMEEETRKELHSRLADYFTGQTLYLNADRTTGTHPDVGNAVVGAIHELPLQPNGRKLMELPYHLSLADRIQEARDTITDFDFAMAKCRLNRSDDWVNDFFKASAAAKMREYRIWESFAKTNAHILRRGNADWPAHKILLQLAIEHADDSPATIVAEKFLEEGKCDWAWLRRELRVEHAGADPCVAVFEGHGNYVLGVLDLKDGRLLSWAGDDIIRIWNIESGICLQELSGHTEQITGTAILPNNRILSWSNDSSLRIWDDISGTCLSRLAGHNESVSDVLLLTNSLILSWSSENTLLLWSNQGSPYKRLEGHSDYVKGAIQMPDDRILSWAADKTLLIWSNQGELLLRLEGHTDEVCGVKILSDDKILSWGDDKTIRLWNSLTGTCEVVFRGHSKPVEGVLILPNDNIATWSSEKTFLLWDINNGKSTARFEGHTRSICGVHFLKGNKLLSWSDDKTIRLWDSISAECIAVLKGHTDYLDCTIHSNGNVLSWSYDRSIRIWDSDSGNCLKIMEGHTSDIAGIQLLPNSRILSWAKDNSLRIWDICSGECLKVLSGHSSLIFKPLLLDSGELLTWSIDHTIRKWNIESDELSYSLPGHTNTIVDAQIQLSGTTVQIITCSWDNDLRIWDAESGVCTAVLKGHKDRVNGIKVLSDGRILSWSMDGTLRIWDNNFDCQKILKGHKNSIKGVKLLSGVKVLSWCESVALDSPDYDLRIWNIDTGKCIKKLVGHTNDVQGVATLVDGRILSWSFDNDLRMWDVENGECVAILKGHEDAVKGAKIFPDGRILSWSADNTLRIWDNCGNGLDVLNRHNSDIIGALITPDGSIITWAYDNKICIWGNDGQYKVILEGHTDIVNGMQLLPDSRFISWSDDGTLRVWSPDGIPIKKYYLDDLFDIESHIWKSYLSRNQQTESAALCCNEMVELFVPHENKKIIWNADSGFNAQNMFFQGRHHLLTDTHAMVSQDSGQVCFLRRYQGNRRVTLEEFSNIISEEAIQ